MSAISHPGDRRGLGRAIPFVAGGQLQRTADMAGDALGQNQFTRRSLAARSIAVMPRILDGVVVSALDAIADEAALAMAFEEVVATSDAPGLKPAFRSGQGLDNWLADWLASDVTFLMNLHRELTGARRQKARLQALAGQLCPKFHVDSNRFRMVTTYRGPGTEWLEDPEGARLVRRLPRGHVAMMRGALAATGSMPAVVHRSPPADGDGIRLLLVIDQC